MAGNISHGQEILHRAVAAAPLVRLEALHQPFGLEQLDDRGIGHGMALGTGVARRLGDPGDLLGVAPAGDHAPEGLPKPQFAFDKQVDGIVGNKPLLGKVGVHLVPVGMADRDPVLALPLGDHDLHLLSLAL